MSEAVLPIPAVDLAGGRVVRLLRGERAAETVYGEEPSRFVERFIAEGATWLHVVDLDRAFGDGENRVAVGRLVRDTAVRVQVAGGVRTLEDFRRWRERGAARVVFGTAAIESPEMVEAAISEDGAGVAVALDVKDGRLRTRGWVDEGGAPEELARRYAKAGAECFIHTGIDRDGTLEGPDVNGALGVALASGVSTIVAGGIGNAEHLARIREIARRAPITGAILGRSLYEGRLSLSEARRALR